MDQCISGLGVCYLAFHVFLDDRKVLNKFKCGLGMVWGVFVVVWVFWCGLGCFNGPHAMVANHSISVNKGFQLC